MRALFLGTAAVLASPVAAQEHSAHESHRPVGEARATVGAEIDDSAVDHPTMDHDAMDERSTGGSVDHAAMKHEAMNPSAMDHESMNHSAMNHSAVAAPPSGPPPRAFEGPPHAADEIYGSAAMAPARGELLRENGGFSGGTFMFDRLEAKVGKGENLYFWDAQGWYGGDIDKLWIKSEGEGAFGGKIETAEVQALWSHAIGPWFDLQTGARYDLEPQGRAHAVLGVQGLAPYMFEVDAAAFLSDHGDLTARFEAEYDQRITQRLILQPRAEVTLAAQNVPSARIGSGVSSVEMGLRLRYEIVREFAPYVGIGYEAKVGRTADLARAVGEDPTRVSLLVGVRAWF